MSARSASSAPPRRALTAAKRLAGQADSFRTGDFGFFDQDGLLHPAGRKDQMVKIRGHRLDLGEVEAVLKMHCRLGDAVAIAFGGDDGTDIEIRAAVLAGDDPGLLAELRRLTRECLPAFAQPGRILALRQFPLLPTGKVDRQALRRLLEEA